MITISINANCTYESSIQWREVQSPISHIRSIEDLIVTAAESGQKQWCRDVAPVKAGR